MVPYVSERLADVVVGTTAGFPHGTEAVEAKVRSAELSIENGATEIDFVINIGKALDRDFDYIEKEFLKMAELKDKAGLPEFNVKAILEVCFIPAEIVKELVEIAISTGIDYVKTSTGFGPRGATPEDVRLLVELARGRIKVKASGGIRTLDQVREFLLIGADRIGTSSGDEILREAAAILPD
jgi:deoxyribose-phosphate aldolase